MRRAIRQALAEIAAEQVAADPRDEQPGGQARNRVVRPGEQADLLRRQERPAADQASYETAVRNEPAVSEREQIPDGLELVRIGHDVKNSRTSDGSERRHH